MPKDLSASVFACFRALFFIAILANASLADAQAGGSVLPNLGDGEGMSLAAERTLGQTIAHEIYRDPDTMDDPILGDYLQSVWQPLLASSRRLGEISPEMDALFAWRPFLVRDRTVNAFALPGGYMGVNLGLIALVGSRDELASVLAHELSHITQRHIARVTAKKTRQTPLMLAAMIVGMLVASRSPDAGSAAMVGGAAVAQQSQLNFSREMEREADRIGFLVMTGAGFDGRAFVTMFDKLDRANRINDNGSYPYLRTHPLTTERMADAQLRLREPLQTGVPPVPASAEPLMMAARAKVLVNPGVDGLRALVAQADSALAPTSAGAGAGALYGAILAKLRLQEPQGIGALLGRLTQLTAQDPPAARATTLLAAQVALAQGDAPHALALLAPWVPVQSSPAASQSGAPRAALLMTAQADQLIGSPVALEHAAALLQTHVALHPRDATAWQMLSQVYARQGQPVRSIQAEAEGRVAELEYAAALDRFKAAQALIRNQPPGTPQDDIEASIIDTRARQVALLLREQALER